MRNFKLMETPADALVYLADCQTATFDTFASLPKPPLGETARHLSIMVMAIVGARKHNTVFTRPMIDNVIRRARTAIAEMKGEREKIIARYMKTREAGRELVTMVERQLGIH